MHVLIYTTMLIDGWISICINITETHTCKQNHAHNCGFYPKIHSLPPMKKNKENCKKQGKVQNYLRKKKDERKCQGESCSSVNIGSHPTACKHSEITEHLLAPFPAQKQAGNGLRLWFWGNLCRFLLPQQAGCPERLASARSRKHAGKNSQNNWIYTFICTHVSLSRLWKEEKNRVFIFIISSPQTLKKKKKPSQFLFYPDQFINPKS